MNQTFLRILIGLVGLASLLGGLAFLVNPDRAALRLGILARDVIGSAAIRADFAALFGVCGLFALAAAWLGDGRLLTAPLLFAAIALSGRIISYALSGGGTAALAPMAVEAIALIIFVLGRMLLPIGGGG